MTRLPKQNTSDATHDAALRLDMDPAGEALLQLAKGDSESAQNIGYCQTLIDCSTEANEPIKDTAGSASVDVIMASKTSVESRRDEKSIIIYTVWRVAVWVKALIIFFVFSLILLIFNSPLGWIGSTLKLLLNLLRKISHFMLS